MSKTPPAQNPAQRPGLNLGRIAGVRVRVDWSLLFIFLLVAMSLGGGAIPSWHPDWGFVATWGVAIAAAIAFFASVLLHELAHAVVGRAQGIDVPAITLFMFGGVAHARTAPPSPRAELLMAAVGPLTSFVIGVVAISLGASLVPEEVLPTTAAASLDPLRNAGPFATILLWLGPINVLLAVFNLLPGFPLDGGQVLRSLLWAALGDRLSATRWAARAGVGLAYLLIAAGVAMAFGLRLPVLGHGLLSGLWLVLIGWFLSNAARQSFQQELVRRSLSGVTVRELMRSEFDTVPPTLSLSDLIRDHVQRTGQQTYPVTDAGGLEGVISLPQVTAVSPERRAQVQVGAVMTPASRVLVLRPDTPATEALQLLAADDRNQLLVLDRGELRGLLRQQDVLRWLSLEGTRDAA